MATWRVEIFEALRDNSETWLDDVESCTLTQGELDREFDEDYGLTQGLPFTVWTAKHVYFPIVYDGSEWVGCVARNPDGKPTKHQGGGG